jgi:glutaredoxin
MQIVIYTQPSCSACVRAKNILKSREIPFIEYEIGGNMTLEEFQEEHPGIKRVPYMPGIGGYEDLIEAIAENPNLGKLLLNE